MPTANNPILSRMVMEPLLIEPQSVDLFADLMDRLYDDEQFMQAWEESAATHGKEGDFWDGDDFQRAFRPYSVQNGTLVVPVKGVLLNRFGYQFGRWATGYQYIEKAVERGMADPEVERIAFDIDSPGGVVAGNFELVERLAADKRKKKYAFAEDHAFSAAYSIATAADEISLTRSGGVGSVGVVAAHVEMSEALSKMGVRVTFIYAGKHKIDGNAYQKLPEEVRDRFQTRVDRLYGQFVGLVAENRGMDEQAVRNTEALTYDSTEAVDIGFADRVGSINERLADLSEATNGSYGMTTKQNAPAEANTGHTDEQLQAAVSAAKAEGYAEGATAERTRITAILDSDAGKAHPKAALSAALKTNMTADEAIAFLGDLPEEKAEAPQPAPAPQSAQGTSAGSPFDGAMAATGNPNVGAEAPEEPEQGTPASNSAQILSSFGRASGRGRRTA